MAVEEIRKQLRKLGNKEKAKVLQRFFKTAPGEYGKEGDFLGIRVSQLRKVAHEFCETMKISKILLSDNEDLIHEAVGWMLREVGKRNLLAEEKFLEEHYKAMPRTMPRYTIERLPESKRNGYLSGKNRQVFHG